MSRERQAAAAAKSEVPCKPECQDTWCICDEDTRNRRLVVYSQRLRSALAELEGENARLRASVRELEEEIEFIDKSEGF
jgi:hypothetical protein